MRKSDQQLEENAANAASALSPLLGFDASDLKQAFNDLGGSFARHPLLAMAALKSISQEQWTILQGNGNWQPSAKDKRFRDPQWRENRYFRTLLQFYLSSTQGLRDWMWWLTMTSPSRS